MKDDLGKRMKDQYEMRTRTWLPRRTYTIIRLDGKAFHTFTRGFNKPFDEDLAHAMDETAKFLCENVQGTDFAYVQSDEISLLLTDFSTITTNAWFDGQVQKMVSVASSLATGKFNNVMHRLHIVAMDKLAFFDARVFTIPDPIEVENYFIWRQKDAIRNSISMLAQSLYSHRELHGKSQSDMQEMTFQKGKNWNDTPAGFKRGRTILKDVNGEWHVATPEFTGELPENRRVISEFIPKINES